MHVALGLGTDALKFRGAPNVLVPPIDFQQQPPPQGALELKNSPRSDGVYSSSSEVASDSLVDSVRSGEIIISISELDSFHTRGSVLETASVKANPMIPNDAKDSSPPSPTVVVTTPGNSLLSRRSLSSQLAGAAPQKAGDDDTKSAHAVEATVIHRVNGRIRVNRVLKTPVSSGSVAEHSEPDRKFSRASHSRVDAAKSQGSGQPSAPPLTPRVNPVPSAPPRTPKNSKGRVLGQRHNADRFTKDGKKYDKRQAKPGKRAPSGSILASQKQRHRRVPAVVDGLSDSNVDGKVTYPTVNDAKGSIEALPDDGSDDGKSGPVYDSETGSSSGARVQENGDSPAQSTESSGAEVKRHLEWPLLTQLQKAALVEAGFEVQDGSRKTTTPMLDVLVINILLSYPGVYLGGHEDDDLPSIDWLVNWQGAKPTGVRFTIGDPSGPYASLRPSWELHEQTLLSDELCVEFNAHDGSSFMRLPYGLRNVQVDKDFVGSHYSGYPEWQFRGLGFYNDRGDVWALDSTCTKNVVPSFRKRSAPLFGSHRGDPNKRTASGHYHSRVVELQRFYAVSATAWRMRSMMMAALQFLVMLAFSFVFHILIVQVFSTETWSDYLFGLAYKALYFVVARVLERPSGVGALLSFVIYVGWYLTRKHTTFVLVPEALHDVAVSHILSNPTKYVRADSFAYLASLAQTYGVLSNVGLVVTACLDSAERECDKAIRTVHPMSWLPRYVFMFLVKTEAHLLVVVFSVFCIVLAFVQLSTGLSIAGAASVGGLPVAPLSVALVPVNGRSEIRPEFHYKTPTIPPVPSFVYDGSAQLLIHTPLPVVTRLNGKHLRQLGPVVNPDTAPVSYASDWDAMLGGLARQLGRKPINVTMMDRYVHWFHVQFIPFIVELLGVVKAMPWDDFLNRQPVSIRRLYIESKDRYERNLVQLQKDRKAKVHAKVEKNDPNYDAGFSPFSVAGKKAVRVITDTSKNQCFRTGPWFVSLAKQLAKKCGFNSQLFYTSGTVPSEVGRFVGQLVSDGFMLYENDCSKWDGHQVTEVLECLIDLFEALGMDSELVLQYREDLRWAGTYTIRGKGVLRPTFSMSMSVNGTQGSGRPETSVGNTLVNFSLHLFADYCQRDPSVTVSQQLTWMRIMALGDDNVSGVVQSHAWNVDFVASVFRQLGHEPKLVQREMDDLEFCSSWFIPSNDGMNYTMVPKFGRLVSRFPWHVIPTRDVDDEERCARLRSDLLGRRGVLRNCPYLSGWFESMMKFAVAGSDRCVSDKLNRSFNQWVDEHVEWNFAQTQAFYRRYGVPPGEFVPFEDIHELRVDYYLADMLRVDMPRDWVCDTFGGLYRESSLVIGQCHELGRLSESDFSLRFEETAAGIRLITLPEPAKDWSVDSQNKQE